MSESAGGGDRGVQRKQRVRELPPGKLDVIYTSGFPPFWKIWRKGMMTVEVELQQSRREAVDEVERSRERREARMMEAQENCGEQAAGPDRATRSKRAGELPPITLDVIYIGGFPPFWKIWRKGMMTVEVEPRQSRREAVDGIEWDQQCREAGTMAELANRAEQAAGADRAERSKLPPAKFDVIYIGGIPPLRQIWADFKAVVKARRESPPTQ